jgi:hypothetical protein
MNLLLQNAMAYLAEDRRIARQMQVMLVAPTIPDSPHKSIPVLYMEADSSAVPVSKLFYPATPEFSLIKKESELRELFFRQDLPWQLPSVTTQAQIERFLTPLVEGLHGTNEQHDARVRERIWILWRNHGPQMLPSS